MFHKKKCATDLVFLKSIVTAQEMDCQEDFGFGAIFSICRNTGNISTL